MWNVKINLNTRYVSFMNYYFFIIIIFTLQQINTFYKLFSKMNNILFKHLKPNSIEVYTQFLKYCIVAY